MLRLMKLLLAAALVWSLYWLATGWGLRNGISAWFVEQQRQGWQAEFSSLDSSGFPSRHTTRVTHPTLADPGTGAAWRADWLEVESPAIWPGQQILRFPATPQRLSYFDQTTVVLAEDLQAQLYLAPGLSLMLEELTLSSGPWRVRDGDRAAMSARSLQLGMRQTETPERYQVLMSATDFAPGTGLRRLLAATEALPDVFDTLALDMEVTFDTAWDRTALELRRPQPRRIELTLAEAHWGALRIKATGSLTVDEQGLPTGVIALQVENWRHMLVMAEGAGALPANTRNGIEKVLDLFAGLSGNPHDLDTQLNFRDGYIALGPIPLGSAPRLILR